MFYPKGCQLLPFRRCLMNAVETQRDAELNHGADPDSMESPSWCLEICICRGDSLEAFNVHPHSFGGKRFLISI